MEQKSTSDRSLVAIMFTDIVGFSSIMSKDEPFAYEILEKKRKLLYSIVEKYSGRVIKEIGDGSLSSFPSTILAVYSAIELQNAIKEVAGLNIRIGIHVGDIIIRDGDVIGDGVNVTSRIEQLALPGGICISERVYDDIRNQPKISVVSMGKRKLKNIDHPMKIYSLIGEGLPIPGIRKRFQISKIHIAGIITTILLIIITLLLKDLFYFYFSLVLVSVLIIANLLRLQLYTFKHTKKDSKKKVPSIGVLYLKNLGENSDEYLAYGVTEDLIIDLSKQGLIRIPTMNDILPYKEKEISLSSIAKALRVQHLLIGSIHKGSELIRLAFQLVEPSSGSTLWSDRWEKPITELPLLKDIIIRDISRILNIELTIAYKEEISELSLPKTAAYEYYLKGKYQLIERKSDEELKGARELLNKAIKLDPEYIPPRIELGHCFEAEGFNESAEEIYNQALALAEKNNKPRLIAEILLNIAWRQKRKMEINSAMVSYQRALLISESLGDHILKARTLANIASMRMLIGEYEIAIKNLVKYLKITQEIENRYEEAMCRNSLGGVFANLGQLSTALENYFLALAINREIENRRSEIWNLINIAEIYWFQGNNKTALEYLSKSLSISQEINEQENVAFSYVFIGSIKYSESEYELSIENLEAALEMFKKINIKLSFLQALSLLALNKIKIGKKKEAEEIMLILEEEFNNTEQDKIIEEETLFYIVQLMEMSGQKDKFKKYLQLAHKEILRRKNMITSEEYKQSYLNLPFVSAIVSKYKQIYGSSS